MNTLESKVPLPFLFPEIHWEGDFSHFVSVVRTVINLNFSGFYFFAYFESICSNLPTAKFRVLILLNLWIIADSNSVQTILSPLEKHRSVINHAPRACAQVVSASCSHRRAYKSNTLNAYRTVINQSRSSICGGFSLRAIRKQCIEPS